MTTIGSLYPELAAPPLTRGAPRVSHAIYEAAHPPTEHELSEDHRQSGASLRRSARLRAATLSLPCPAHGAEAGAYCWDGGEMSRVRGLCMPRVQLGLATPAPQSLDVGELAPLADATRNAARTARHRARVAADRERRDRREDYLRAQLRGAR